MSDLDLEAIEAQARELEAPTLMVTLADGTSPEDAEHIFEAAIEAIYAATDSEVMALAHLAPALGGDPDILPLVAEVRRLRVEAVRVEQTESRIVDILQAERDALRAQRDAVLAVMNGYEDWFLDCPEDSWRLQRDLRGALGVDE